MIFTALGLLVLAAAFLIAGIAKSSVALLMLSLVATLAAGGALAIAYSIARRSGVIPDAPAAQGMVPAGEPGTAAVVMYVPVEQLAAMNAGGNGNGHATATAPSPVNGSAAPLSGYDQMTADQVVKLIGSGALSEAQLQAVREYEAGHGARKTVLDRIDKVLYRA